MDLQGGDTIPLHSLKGDIEFKDVAFSYPSRPQQVSLLNFHSNRSLVILVVFQSQKFHKTRFRF